MMPKMDGATMVMKIRESYDFPIIMLSAKSEDMDKILGLNIGADDYVTKPFNPLELLARVNSQLRRYSKYLNMVKKDEKKTNSYAIGGLEVNIDRKEVMLDGDVVKVTPIEFKILQLLIKSPGRVFSAEEIYERVWNENAVNTDTVKCSKHRHCNGPCKKYKRKNRDRSKKSKIFKGGVGSWL